MPCWVERGRYWQGRTTILTVSGIVPCSQLSQARKWLLPNANSHSSVIKGVFVLPKLIVQPLSKSTYFLSMIST